MSPSSMEPGRVIVGNAGILVTKVLYRRTAKRNGFYRRCGERPIRPASTGLSRDSSLVRGGVMQDQASVDVAAGL